MATNNYSAQGCIPVRRVRNNDSLSISIESTQPLFQGVDANNDNATPFPNWETDDAARPILTPVVKSAKGNIVSLSNHNWKYGDTLLVFSGSTSGTFQLTGDGKFGMDANGRLKIFKNLASSSSTSSDTLTYNGTAKIGDSSTQDVSGFVTILIQPMGNNSYMGWITANRSILTDAPNEDTATLSARLWLSTTELTDFSVKWKKSAGEVLGSDKTLTVTRDMVNGSTLITCEFYHKDAQNVCFRAGKVMTDNADEYVIVGEVSNLIGDKAATITGRIKNTRTNTIVNSANVSWNAKAYKDNNEPIKEVNSNVITITKSESDYGGTEHDAYVLFTATW
nr:MAG TPA: minor structural protein [Caudoviricetes sp.]